MTYSGGKATIQDLGYSGFIILERRVGAMGPVSNDCSIFRYHTVLRVVWNRALVSASLTLPPGSGCLVDDQAKDTPLKVKSELVVERQESTSLENSASIHASRPECAE